MNFCFCVENNDEWASFQDADFTNPFNENKNDFFEHNNNDNNMIANDVFGANNGDKILLSQN